MYILTIYGREEEGAYSVANESGEKVLYLFQEEDDAKRFAMMLEEDDYPEMHVVEIDDDLLINVCHMHEHKYVIITSDDIVVPPNESDFS
jgi:hypothetical protein